MAGLSSWRDTEKTISSYSQLQTTRLITVHLGPCYHPMYTNRLITVYLGPCYYLIQANFFDDFNLSIAHHKHGDVIDMNRVVTPGNMISCWMKFTQYMSMKHSSARMYSISKNTKILIDPDTMKGFYLALLTSTIAPRVKSSLKLAIVKTASKKWY